MCAAYVIEFPTFFSRFYQFILSEFFFHWSAKKKMRSLIFFGGMWQKGNGFGDFSQMRLFIKKYTKCNVIQVLSAHHQTLDCNAYIIWFPFARCTMCREITFEHSDFRIFFFHHYFHHLFMIIFLCVIFCATCTLYNATLYLHPKMNKSNDSGLIRYRQQ